MSQWLTDAQLEWLQVQATLALHRLYDTQGLGKADITARLEELITLGILDPQTGYLCRQWLAQRVEDLADRLLQLQRRGVDRVVQQRLLSLALHHGTALRSTPDSEYT